MAGAVLFFQSTFHFPSSFPFNKQFKLKKPAISFSEIADKSTPFRSPQVTVSSVTSNGNTRGSHPRKGYASGRKKGDEIDKSSDGIKAPKSSSQDEIIALFRRIQSSISKGDKGGKSFSASKDDSPADSVSGVFEKSIKNLEDARPKQGGEALRWRSRVPKKRQRMEKKDPTAIEDFNLSKAPSNFVKRSPIPYPTVSRGGRPPSNFVKRSPIPYPNFVKRSPIPYPTVPRGGRPPSNLVKRSPIPYPTAQGGKNLEQNNEAVETNKGSELANIEKMKLPELKELAKARRIKGYSRLKKSELVQLLRS